MQSNFQLLSISEESFQNVLQLDVNVFLFFGEVKFALANFYKNIHYSQLQALAFSIKIVGTAEYKLSLFWDGEIFVLFLAFVPLEIKSSLSTSQAT